MKAQANMCLIPYSCKYKKNLCLTKQVSTGKCVGVQTITDALEASK